ncbi:Uncharacterised protein [Candidatus Norongarragalina meridionalis]|nr:Uncharacterised protein [Candidatus Norongarragalina meridionalis]
MLDALGDFIEELQVNALIFFDYLTVTLFGPLSFAADSVLWIIAAILLFVALV